jgi:hypothetical protein
MPSMAALLSDKDLLVECCLNTSNREAFYTSGGDDLGLREHAIHTEEVGG